jgi:hypothetical protein
MNTTDIENILRADNRCSPYFKGVMARDHFVEFLNETDSPTYSVVFNSDPSHRPGQHWMVFVKNNSKGYYFDSYGQHPSTYPDVKEALSSCVSKVYWSSERLQGLTSNTCGDYCILFCHLIHRGWSMEDIVSTLLSIGSPEKRDHFLRRLTLQTYGHQALYIFRQPSMRVTGVDRLHITDAVIALYSHSNLFPSCFYD